MSDPVELRLLTKKVQIFVDKPSRHAFVSSPDDDQRIVIIGIGAGETKINLLDEEGRPISAWTAVFGWSSLCNIAIPHNGKTMRPEKPHQVEKALRSTLRIYGESVDTSDFVMQARADFKTSLSQIIDDTIGQGEDCDRIVFAAPTWLHGVLAESLSIRPHIDHQIQEL